MLHLIGPAVEEIGWDFKPEEDYLTGQLRALLITTAGGVEHPGTVAEATKRLAAYRAGDTDAIHPNLRLAVFRIAVQTGGREAYEYVKKYYLETNSGEARELCLTAMGRVQEAALVREYLDFQFSGAVALQDLHTGSMSLALNSTARPTLWEWIQGEWGTITGRLGGTAVAMDRYVRVSLKQFATKETLEQMEAFFKEKDTSAFARSLVQVFDTVRGNVAYRERDEMKLLEYLQAHGYV